jgi:hypothetical protein
LRKSCKSESHRNHAIQFVEAKPWTLAAGRV